MQLQWNLSITDKLEADVLSFIWRLSFIRGYDLILIHLAYTCNTDEIEVQISRHNLSQLVYFAENFMMLVR